MRRPWSGHHCTMELGLVTFITAVGLVQHGAVIPHDHHPGLPLMAVLELRPGLPEIEFQQQLFGLGLLHSVYTYDVTEATEQAFLAGLRMPADKRVQLGIVGGFGGMDPEAALLAAGLLLFSIHTGRRIGQARRVDGLLALDAFAQLRGHCLQRRMLVDEVGIAAMGRYDNAMQYGGCRRVLAEAPVGVPRIGKDGGGFIRRSTDLDDIGAVVQRRDVGITGEGAEVQAEAFEVLVIHILVGKGEHMVPQPGLSNIPDHARVQLPGQIQAGYGGAAGALTGCYGKGHFLYSRSKLAMETAQRLEDTADDSLALIIWDEAQPLIGS